MNLKQIENQALDLSEEERAQLAQRLILSLESSNEEGVEKEWLLEAKRRAVEIDKGEVQPVPAEEVRKKLKHFLDELLLSSKRGKRAS